MRLADAEDGILACVHCGLCLPACPTFRVLGDENDSPRGRVYLMRALVEGRVEPEGAFATHIGRCLGCRACETACPAGVRFGALLEKARADLSRARRITRWWTRAALRLLTGGLVSRWLYALLRLVRRSGLATLAGRLLPGRVGLAGRLLAASSPAGRPVAGWPVAGNGRAEGTPTEAEASTGAEASTYALLEGCVSGGLFGHVHRAARAALAADGFVERSAPEQKCCGALHAHAGLEAEARALARRNVAAFERSGARWVVADAAGCGAALREYGAWLADDPEWAGRARALSERARDVTELLAAPANGAGAREGARFRLPAPARMGYDAPCHLLHAQRVDAAPLSALARVEGLHVRPLPSSDRCCGGAGIYNLLHPTLSADVLDEKLGEIRSGGYQAILTGNPGCAMQIGAGLRATGDRTPVLHPVEVLAIASAEPGRR